MKLWIDDTQIDATDNLEAAFEIARKHAEDAGRLIIDIQADGQPIDDALIDEPPTDAGGISELRLTTTDFGSFLIETISSAKEALDLTREDQIEAADQIRTGEFDPAIESLKAVLEGWHAVRDVVGTIRSSCRDQHRNTRNQGRQRQHNHWRPVHRCPLQGPRRGSQLSGQARLGIAGRCDRV